jgi:hypothetical protein
MKKHVLVAAVAGLLPFCWATARPESNQADGTQTSASSEARKTKMKTGMGQIPTDATINATLTKAIDAQQSKPGDEVDARTTAAVKAGGRVIIPKGTKLVGHIAEVKAKSDDEPTSTVLVEFDRAVMKSGSEMPLHVSIASIARPQASAAPTDDMPGDMGMPAESMGSPSAAPRAGIGGGGGMHGATSSTGHAKPNSTSAAAPPPAPGQPPDPQPKAAASFTIEQRPNGTVISSNSQNVHLDSGTQLLLKVLASK